MKKDKEKTVESSVENPPKVALTENEKNLMQLSEEKKKNLKDSFYPEEGKSNGGGF